MIAAAPKQSLRERKKRRTRQTIVDAATRLFVEQGYDQTTLVQVAEAADVATSTFFNYFPTKVDIVFSVWDIAIESARRRISERPEGEPAIDAITAWLTEELPGEELPYAESVQRIPTIISSVPDLVAEERLRLALLEDVLAAGFARDLGESADGVRARALGAMALAGMNEAWHAWFEKHSGDADFRLSEALEAKAEHVVRVIEVGFTFIGRLPAPPATL